MDVHIITTSLEALIQRATNSTNAHVDASAVEAFCVVLGKEQEGPYIATRLIAAKMQSESPTTAMMTLDLLQSCMTSCGPSFHAEVGKFKFLNEMVKLVSPKYLGNRTPPPIKDKVLLLMHQWTLEYPREIKIKEAYEMLRKQGVVKDDVPPLLAKEEPVSNNKGKNAVFEDDEKSKLLKRLLQSKNPDDLQAANRLIKTMVREDERRVEMVHRRISDLSTVNNNISLLNEMLTQYRHGVTSEDDVQLIRELHTACQRLQPTVYRLAQETQDQEEMLNLTSAGGGKNLGHFWSLTKQFDEILHTSDELSKVFDKYQTVIIQGKTLEIPDNQVQYGAASASLVDLLPVDIPELKPETTEKLVPTATLSKPDNDLDDIFASLDINVNVNTNDILQPISLKPEPVTISSTDTNKEEKTAKLTALDELDFLGANMLKQNLPDNCKAVPFNKSAEKVPMNVLAKSTQNDIPAIDIPTLKQKQLDLNFLIGDSLLSTNTTLNKNDKNETNATIGTNINGADDLMVDITENTATAFTLR